MLLLPLFALLPLALAAQSGVVQDKNIEYWTVDGTRLAMDVVRPAAPGSYPGVILIHGGGFTGGTRESFLPAAIKLAQNGYVAATADYRLAPKFHFPAQIHDAKAAVRFLRANASRFSLDPAHIGAIGVSAGGTIALFLGVARGVGELEGPGPLRDISSGVDCVVNLYGRSDLMTAYGGSRNAADALPAFVGGSLPQARLEHVRASPINWVTPGSAPVLSIHGTLDLNVPYPQSVALQQRLWAAGVEGELETMVGAGHGFKGSDAELADRVMIRFLDRHLKRTPGMLESRVQSAIGQFEGTVSLFAKNIESGQSFGLRADERVRTASTIKLAILTAVFSAVAAGSARWDETLPLASFERVSGSGVIKEFSDNVKLPLRDLARMMIVVSDNTATNLILDRFTADFVNAEMNKLGLVQTRSLRKILGDSKDIKPELLGLSKEGALPENDKYGIGVTTPREMVSLLEKIERGEAVNAASSREMIAILKRQQFKDGIGRRMEGKYVVASKSGSLDALRSDVGIAYTKGGPVAMAITVDGMPKPDWSPENPGSVLIGKLAEILAEELRAKAQGLRSSAQ